MTSALRAIAKQPELEVTFAAERPGLSPGKARLPEPARKLTRKDAAIVRGHGDAMALRLAVHNAKIHREELAAFAESRLGIAGEATAPERRARPLYVVPLFGWLLIAYGLLWPFSHPVLRGIWYIDLFLSIVVHGAQLWVALPAGRRAGLHPAYTTFMTFLLGATWWRPLRARGSLR